jgi:FMN phosphatase YigB (HAD superfamily)
MFDFIARHLDLIDGVVFDFGGVMAPAPGDDWPLYPFFERAGITMDAVKAWNEKYRPLADRGDITMEELYMKMLADRGVEPPEPGFCLRAAEIDGEGWANFKPATYELMKELKALGKKLGILSNMSQFYYEHYFTTVAAHIRALCDAEVISWQVHLLKPQREIYDIAAERMGVSPERLLFLDDTLVNVQTARNCGWRSERYVLSADGEASGGQDVPDNR